MAFVSIGQKYGFVSIGDHFRQQMAEERKQMAEERKQMAEERQQMEEQMAIERKQFKDELAEEHQKIKEAVEEKINTARKMVSDQKLTIEEVHFSHSVLNADTFLCSYSCCNYQISEILRNS